MLGDASVIVAQSLFHKYHYIGPLTSLQGVPSYHSHSYCMKADLASAISPKLLALRLFPNVRTRKSICQVACLVNYHSS